jgi:uncharacterized protein YdeI (YjbR/CyaY-like superfamily)
VIFFGTGEAFRAWMRQHHATTAEVLVGFHKKVRGTASLTWPESVDVALCFGWIDGVRRNVDATRYCIRFTPRRKGSIWSAVNIRRVPELAAMGLVRPEGLRAFEARTEKRSQIYSYEQKKEAALNAAEQSVFEAQAQAWAFFQARPPGYRKTLIWWVLSAKREETRKKRLATLIESCGKGVLLR